MLLLKQLLHNAPVPIVCQFFSPSVHSVILGEGQCLWGAVQFSDGSRVNCFEPRSVDL